MRTAISPRLATNTLENISSNPAREREFAADREQASHPEDAALLFREGGVDGGGDS